MDRDAPPVVLLTGCSSGIGRAAVEALRERGCRVVATARNITDIADLESEETQVLRLDVTDDRSMQRGVAAVADRYGRIDALVNNAGYGVMLPLEELPVEAIRRMFDVNVFGLHRMTQLVLPHMRQQSPGRGGQRGRIVNVASAAAQVPLPMMGAYSGTKAAVYNMTLALREEVRPHGVHASLIEPGRIRTRFGDRSHAERSEWLADHSASPYRWLHERWHDVRFNEKGKDVSLIARQVVHACTARRPRLHYRSPMDAKGAVFARRFLPDRLVLLGIRGYFAMKRPHA